MAVSAGVGALSLGTGIYKSIKQGSEANAIDKANPRPTYAIPDEFKQNQAMAAQMARIGLPQQQYNNQQNAIQRNQAGGLSALATSNNPGGGIASIVRAGNDANNSLNSEDAATRQNNQRYAIEQNGVLGNQELAQQQYNDFDKYTENFNRAQALRGAANTNLNNGINSAAGIATSLAAQQNGGGNQTFGQATNTAQLPAARQGGFGTPYVAPGQVFNQTGSNYTPSQTPLYTNWTPFQ